MAKSNYEICIDLQKNLDDSTGDLQSRITFATQVLQEFVNPSFIPHVRVARAERGIQIPDELTADSYEVPQREFGDIILKGMVPRVSCVQVDERLLLTLPFYSSTVLGPVQDIELDLVPFEAEDADMFLIPGQRITRPVHLPVESLQYTRYAA